MQSFTLKLAAEPFCAGLVSSGFCGGVKGAPAGSLAAVPFGVSGVMGADVQKFHQITFDQSAYDPVTFVDAGNPEVFAALLVRPAQTISRISPDAASNRKTGLR